MSSQRRAGMPSETEALYQPLPQSDPIAQADSSDLQLEADEEALAEEFVAQEHSVTHDSRIHWIHFILGCAVLLPWNALITATPYFLTRLQGSSLKSSFSSYLSVTFTVTNFVALAHATVSAKQSTNSRKALITLSTLTILTFMLTVSTYFHPGAGGFFAFVMLNAIGQAIAGSYLQTSVIAVASLFGPTAMQAIMSGQAAVAVAVSGVTVVSSALSLREKPSPQALADSEPEAKAAFMFFGLSTLFYLVSAGAHIWLTHLPAYHNILAQFEHTVDVAHDEHSLKKREQLIRVAKSNVIFNFAVAYVFIITLSVFPPITISVQPTNPATHPLLFSAIHFFVFNIGDFGGRFMCRFPRVIIWSSKRLLIISLARTLFIPIFLMCNVQRPSTSTNSGAIISSDVVFMLILLAFGLTNGYTSSLCMMAAPSVEHNPRLKGRVEDVDVAATVATFCLVGGLAIGGFASFGVAAAVAGG